MAHGRLMTLEYLQRIGIDVTGLNQVIDVQGLGTQPQKPGALRKLKILALHGKDQNMVIFKKRLKASFKSKLKSVAEIVAVDALHLRHLEEKGRSREWAQIRGTDVTGATAHDSMLLEKDDPYSFKDREQVRFVSGRCPLLMLNGTPLPEGRYFVRPQSHRARESFVDLYKDEALEAEVSLAAGQAARDLGSLVRVSKERRVWYNILDFDQDEPIGWQTTQQAAYVGVEASLHLLEHIWRHPALVCDDGDNAPFDGILGFSSGGAMASIFTDWLRDCKLAEPRFVIICSSSLTPLPRNLPQYGENRLCIPSFHVFGNADLLCPPSLSERLADHFEGSTTYVHDGTHHMPDEVEDGAVWLQLREFLEPFQLSGPLVFDGDSATVAGVSSDATLANMLQELCREKATRAAQEECLIKRQCKKEAKRAKPTLVRPALATAALLVRIAVSQVLGLRVSAAGGACGRELLLFEPGSSKISMSLLSCSQVLPKANAEQSILLDEIQAVVNELVQNELPISVFELDRDIAEARYGTTVCEDSAPSDTETLRLAYVPGSLFLEIPGEQLLCAKTSSCGDVAFCGRVLQPGSNRKLDTILLPKQKRLDVCFRVESPDAPSIEMQPETRIPSADDVKRTSDMC